MNCNARCQIRAFTLVELLVVIAVIAILAAIFLPVLDQGKQRAWQTSCLNHHKQLAMAWLIYANDNHGNLVIDDPRLGSALVGTNYPSWVYGDMTTSDATNAVLIQMGLLYPDANNVSIYHCPADQAPYSIDPGSPTHMRSYSMQAQLAYYQNGSPANFELGYPPMYKEDQIRRVPPCSTIVFLDESPDTINDGFFAVWVVANQWADFPAYWHGDGCNFSFADGHAEHWRWQDPRTASSNPNSGSPPYPDLIRMQADLGYQ